MHIIILRKGKQNKKINWRYGNMTLKQLLENRLEDLEAEAKRVCGNDEGAYYAFYELEIEALKKEIAKAE
jgi:hypothetical protein